MKFFMRLLSTDQNSTHNLDGFDGGFIIPGLVDRRREKYETGKKIAR